MEEETQKIGELFVVHYYTQMHTDPCQMHRFYLDESTFTRGGPEMGKESSVKGQKAINEKILSLGLQQVHTKIRQVDCHQTVSNNIGPCIVVQVTGELSVAGYPMRPFVQTFVLAQVSERKYYIHNDIFRYQIYDEDFVSEGDGNETCGVVTTTNPRSGSGDEEEVQLPEQQEVTLPPRPPSESREQENETVNVSSPVPPPPQQVMEMASNSWGQDHYEVSSDAVIVQANGLPENEPSAIDSPSYPVTDINEAPPTAPPTNGPTSDENEVTLTATSNISWAAKLKSAKNQSIGVSNTQTGSNTGTGNKQFSSSSQPPTNRSSANTLINSSSQPLPQREPKTSARKPLPNTTPGGGGDVNKFDSKPKPSFVSSSTNNSASGGGFFPSSAPSLSRTTPDSHQIFVGNLPNSAKEEELKDVFKSYGNVIEVRINPKNFGFIVFDGEAAVQTIMNERSETVFMLHDRRLNIEEKRPSFQKSFQNNSGGNFGGNSRVFGANRMQRSGGMVSGGSSRPPPRR